MDKVKPSNTGYNRDKRNQERKWTVSSAAMKALECWINTIHILDRSDKMNQDQECIVLSAGMKTLDRDDKRNHGRFLRKLSFLCTTSDSGLFI